MNGENLAKIYTIETKIVSLLSLAKVRGKKGNKKVQASPAMLLKTNVEKIPTFCLATMFMKTNELNHFCHDVDEK